MANGNIDKKENPIENLMGKYYDYKGFPCKWEKKKFPVIYKTKSKKQIIYEFDTFFNEASEINEIIFNDMISCLPE